MQRKFIFALSLFALILCTVAFADDGNVFYESFPDDSAFLSWDGGFPEEADDGCICAVNNGYGEEINGKISHLLSYMSTVMLEEGKIYKISLSVLNPAGEASDRPVSAIRFGDGRSNIIFEFDRIPDRSSVVSEFFMVPKTDYYSFGIELKHGDAGIGFFADDILIEEIDLNPESLTIFGETELSVPATGSVFYRYSAAARSTQGEIINLLSDITRIDAVSLPAGVYFDSETNTLEVTSDCPDNSNVILRCTPADYLEWGSAQLEISLSKNLLKNHDFTNGDKWWTADGAYDTGVSSFVLYTEAFTPYGYAGVLRPTYPVVLTENVMYVLRARVSVAQGNDFSVYSQNIALSRDGRVQVTLLNLPDGNQTEVIAAFTPEVSGVYDLSFAFVTAEAGEVIIHEMTLAPELPDETRLTLHAPGNIAVPDTQTEYPVNAYIRDQEGNIMNSRCTLELYPQNNGVELLGDRIVVSPDAVCGEYEIYAYSDANPSMNSHLSFSVSNEFVGDGRFEEKAVGQWWAAAAPAYLRIEEGESKFLHITSEDSSAIVLNNSYMHLYPEFSYAFRAVVTDGGDCTVTAFLETIDGERVPLIQSELNDNVIFELFQTETELVGRLILYISNNYGEAVELSLDNIELFRSIVSASSPTITGLADSGAIISAQFNFFNNLDPNNDPSACAVSWYGTDGKSAPVHVGSGIDFKILPDLVGKYVYFEVTPICAVTGLSGTPLQSVPISVGEIQIGEIIVDRPQNNPPQKTKLSPVKLSRETQMPFSDMEHWSAKYVAPLYNSQIVTGKTATEFCPDENITRAEFAATVARAFKAEGGELPFYDVDPSAYYAQSVAALSSLGVISGISATEFAPDAFLTREQMTLILMRAYSICGYSAQKVSTARFYDRSDISPWAADAVGQGLAIGMINGTEQSTLMPKSCATRAEACAMLCRLLYIIEDLT